MLTSDALAGLLADRSRLKALSAVALGATSPAEVAAASGLSPRQVTGALHRLQDLVVEGPDGLQVAYDDLRALAARQVEHEPLRPFVQGSRLRSLPSSATRRREVLAHVAEQVFEEGRDQTEPEVNALLGAWCEGGEVDHAALRRYLVEAGLVSRAGGVYRRGGSPIEPTEAEQALRALGLA